MNSVFPFLPQKRTTTARIRTELVAEKEPFQNVNKDHDYARYLDSFPNQNRILITTLKPEKEDR